MEIFKWYISNAASSFWLDLEVSRFLMILLFQIKKSQINAKKCKETIKWRKNQKEISSAGHFLTQVFYEGYEQMILKLNGTTNYGVPVSFLFHSKFGF